ncbi:MAG: nucleotide exchange factor GrpE [Firmicutes bacterium]|nr:nucleotide exchange factor GrpE [Bacillota bacterium]
MSKNKNDENMTPDESVNAANEQQSAAQEPQSAQNGANTAQDAQSQYMDPSEAEEQKPQDDEKAKLQAKIDYYIDIARRTQADFENYRKRNLTARAEALAEGRLEAVKAFLPVIDNIDRAIAHAKEGDPVTEGLILVRRQIDKTLADLEIQELGTVGEKFDPNLHEAVMQAPAQEGQESGVVAEIFQKGYRMGDKVIRYTMVKVTE